MESANLLNENGKKMNGIMSQILLFPFQLLPPIYFFLFLLNLMDYHFNCKQRKTIINLADEIIAMPPDSLNMTPENYIKFTKKLNLFFNSPL
jgi:hypothetical protein